MKSNNGQKQCKANFNARFKNAHFRFRMKKTILFSKYPIKRLNFLNAGGNGMPF